MPVWRRTSWGSTKPPLGVLPAPDAVASLGLQMAWLFNEGGGNQVGNAILPGGKSPLGTLQAGTAWVPGLFGPALSFDGGATAYVAIVSNIATANEFTVSAWIAPNGGANYSGILATPGGTVGFYWMPTTTVLDIVISGDHNSNSSLLLNGQWSHVALTRDSANTGHFYVDGVAVGNTGGGAIPGNITWGAIGGDNINNAFQGTIDHVLLTNRCLTPDAVLRLYTEPFWWLAPPPPSRAYSLPAALPLGSGWQAEFPQKTNDAPVLVAY